MSQDLMTKVGDLSKTSLQCRLESISSLSIDYIVLLAGSTMLATFGLFQNSPAVIIGAMIIAPLMRPLLGLSLATLTGDSRLLLRAFLTLVTGTALALILSGGLALFFDSLELTDEILGRTHPTLLDLGVAVIAGAIGAYCKGKDELNDTIAGVAIAVALVPPLSVVGIGLARNLAEVWTGAALLYLTNLVGITTAGALVFLAMGHSPFRHARKGLAISAVVFTLLVVPLALSMRELLLENQISAIIKKVLKEKTFSFRGVQLHSVQVKRFRKPMGVIATVLGSEQPLSAKQVGLVQEFIAKEVGMPVDFKLRIIPSTELTATLDDSKERAAAPPVIEPSAQPLSAESNTN